MVDPEESIDARLAQLVADLAVSRLETSVARGETTVAHGETLTSRGETLVSRQETLVSRDETELAREKTTAALVRVENLEIALKSARVIGMAMGILMYRRDLTEGAAFEALSDASQQQNRKLRVIADDVVATGELPA